jgi:hypothetical protein
VAVDPEVLEAMESAERSLTPFEKERLLDSIILVAMSQEFFTADDVWAVSGVPECKGIGSLMRKASMSGIMTKHGYVPKQSAQGGRWQFTQWRSLVYEGSE